MNEASPNGTMSDPKKCPQCGATLPTGALDGLCPACLLQQGAIKDSATQPAMPPFEPPLLTELARLFPQLEVLELIGKGGMGAVYKARQPSLDRFVALKILPPETVAGQGFGERFNREARALARLGHPNIVAVYDFGQAGGLHYFLMEFVDGVNLRQLQRAGRLSPREALQIIPQICDALQYAHDEGVVHRDIKPENVLVDRKGRVKIADFGLAKILGRDPADLRLTGEGQVMGTPHYMAPEQIEHPLEVDHRADIYSLGVVFYEMLTGELPLGRFAPPSRKVRVDVRLDEVVLHALEKEPELRYQHASEVKTDVQSIAMPRLGPARSTLTKRPSVIAGVLGLLVGLLALVGSMGFTLMQPDEYVSTARVTVERPASERTGTPPEQDRHWLDRELDFARSDLVFNAVVTRLNLKQTWSGLYETHRRLSPAEISAELMRRTEVRRAPHTDVVEISVFSRNAREAADIANAIAETYRSLNKTRKMEIIDAAEPGLRPVRPNRTLNLAVAILLGLLTGGITTGGILLLANRRSRTGNAEEIIPETGVPLFAHSFGPTFRSPMALKLARIGWVVGCLAALGFLPVPIPGWKGIFGLSGFFGLIGVAVLIEQFHRRRIDHSRRQSWWPQVLGAAVLLMIGMMVIVLVVSRHNSPDSQTSLSPAAELGPVMERTIHAIDAGFGSEALHLRTGVVSSSPADAAQSPLENRRRVTAWFKTNEMNLLVNDFQNRPMLLALKMQLSDFPQTDWETATVRDVAAALLEPTSLLHPQNVELATSSYLLPQISVSPLMQAFRTDAGDIGVLQITGISDKPRVVKIRYKLAQPLSSVTNRGVRQSTDSAPALNAPRETIPALTSLSGVKFSSTGEQVIMNFPDGSTLAAKNIQFGPSNRFTAEGSAVLITRTKVAPFSSTSNLTVTKDGTGTYSNIQAAIDAAPPRTTIRIGTGHYEESLVITKPVELIGAGWHDTIIGPTKPAVAPTSEVMREMEAQLRAARSEADRKQLQNQFAEGLYRPVVRIHQTKEVQIQGVKIAQPGAPPDGSLFSAAAVEVTGAQVVVRDCAVLGALGNGIVVAQGSRAQLVNTLVAAAWNTGIVVRDDARMGVFNCDIRNCFYAGITIGRGVNHVRIQACRISGSAWHGIRYDDASPIITNNLIFGNARGGIYASGATSARVEQNVFFVNEMNGMSCWFSNRDLIAGNTFADNFREGLAVLGASAPIVQNNIFSGQPIAILQNRIGGQDAAGQTLGAPVMLGNLFWSNSTNWARPADLRGTNELTVESVELSAESRSVLTDPEFQQPGNRDFSSRLRSLARREGIGAIQPLSYASPWSLQPEEKAIIPDGETRDSRQWKRPRSE